MKKLLLSAAILFISLTLKAQPGDSIPNAGFEAWWFFAGWGPVPGSWTVNVSQILPADEEMDTVAHSGNLAMRMINHGNLRPYAACGFTVSQHPDVMSGFFKNELLANDTAVIRVRIYYNNVVVDSGYREIYSGIIPGYILFSIPLSQNSPDADSCLVILDGGNMYQSSVSFDDLQLIFPTGIDERGTDSGWNVFPNPVTDEINIVSPLCMGENVKIILTDVAGKKIREEDFVIPEQKMTIAMRSLPAGVYLLAILNNERAINKLIVKQ
ncbi:MAG: T9SS type A sorting domain-containing protein [Bacteroidia bacterium]|nr:T9SS type A sorting domain-containing protein [Bacteroidia bacterium]